MRELDLCDCERALGTPHGLTCEKQGYFVTGFENEGSWVRALVGSSVCCIVPPCQEHVHDHSRHATVHVAINSAARPKWPPCGAINERQP